MGEESIDAVSQSLSTLTANLAQNQKILEKGSNTLVSWASSTGKAGQNWTTFSRLTSGTGIWKLQNYLRGTLEMIGKFSDSTKNQIKEQTENEKKLAQTVKGVKKINEEYSALQKTFKNQKTLTKDLSKLESKYNKDKRKLSNRSHTHILKNNKEYQKNLKHLATLERTKIEIAEELEKTENSSSMSLREKTKELKSLRKMELMGIEALKEAEDGLRITKNEAIKQVEENKQMLKETFEAKQKELEQLAELTDQQKEALESTNAYNQAIITGKSEVEAYAEGFKQLSENVKQNQETFDAYKEKMTEALKVKEAFDAGIQSAEFAELGKDVRVEQKETGKENFAENNEALGKVLKNVGKGFLAPFVGVGKFLKAPLESIKKLAPMLRPLKTIRTFVNKNEKIQKMAMKIRMKGLAFQKFMKPVLNMAFKFLIFGILGMIALLAVAKIAYDIMGIMSDFGVFDDMKQIFLAAVDILGAVFGIIGSFMEGDFAAMFDYLGTIMVALMDIGWNLLTIFINGVFSVAVGIFYSLLDFIFWFAGGGYKQAIPVLLKLGVVLLGLYFIKYLAMQVLLLIGIYAIPIMIFVLIAAFVTATVMAVYKHIDVLKAPFEKVLNKIKNALTDDPDKGFWDENKHILGLAKGGMTTGAMNLVGEKGPELVKLPAGSRVYSNSQSKSMSGGSTVINNNITINAKDTSDQELRRIADKIGTMVNNKINRTTSTRTLG